MPGQSRKPGDGATPLPWAFNVLDLLSAQVRAGSDLRQFPAGSEIVREGETGAEAFILLSGRCEVLVHGEVLNHIHPGELFGEIACLGGDIRTATVRAVADSTVLAISAQTLRVELRRSPALLDGFLQNFARRVRDISRRESVARDEHRNLRKVLETLQPALDRFKSHASFTVDVHSKSLTFASGDYYDVLELSPTRVLFAIGDVMGHGAPTTPILSMIRGQLHESARPDIPPNTLLLQLHQHLRRHGHPNVFMTLSLVILDVETAQADVSVAGPPCPLLYRNGECRPLTADVGWTLGYPFDDVAYECDRIAVAAGDVILFYTDGLSDVAARGDADGGTLGTEGLATIFSDAAAAHPPRLASEIFDRIGAAFEDDATALVVSIR